jgi:predicted ATPase
MALTGLAAHEVADFVRHSTDATPSDDLVAAIYAETEGNPLFVGEIVRLLAAEGMLETAPARLKIPEGAREAIARRIRRLGEDTATLLTLASVLGR